MKIIYTVIISVIGLVYLAGCGITPLVPTHMDPIVATNLKAYTLTAQAKTQTARSARGSQTSTPSRSDTPLPSRTNTLSPTVTLTQTSVPSDTPIPVVKLVVFVVACDTGLDISHSMGEVTNAYITVQNVGNTDASGVKVVLQASDENREHPDKQYLVQVLPPAHEIALKLTVDTQDGLPSAIAVMVTSSEEVSASAEKQSCPARTVDKRILDQLGELFRVRPIAP